MFFSLQAGECDLFIKKKTKTTKPQKKAISLSKENLIKMEISYYMSHVWQT